MSIKLILFTFGLLAILSLSGQNNHYQILSETGNNCAYEFRFDTTQNLNWYGVYHTDSGEYITKVDVTIKRYSRGMSMDNKSMAGHYVFWTNKTEKSLFLIGTNKQLTEHKVSHHDDYFLTHTLFLYPGEKKNVYTINKLPNRKTYKLNAIGCVTGFGYCPEFENYRLRLSDESDDWKSQDLSKDISFKGECGLIDLHWFGDIDYDGSPDLLLSTSSTSHTQYNLFLSSEADTNKFVKHVSSFDLGNCY